jgi:hypothetical protein
MSRSSSPRNFQPSTKDEIGRILKRCRLKIGIPSVKNILQIALLLSLFLSSCTVLVPPGPTQKYGANDYAVGQAEPYPQEVKLGKKRLENFIRRANPRQKQLLAENPYVAVQANELVAGEDWPLLRELASGRARAGQYYMQDFRNLPNFPVKFLLIYDTRTERLVKSIGVLVVDTPNPGQVASFTGVRAVYAGTGWWPIL